MMARPDTLLTGSLMEIIVVALMFDDDDGSTPAPDDDEGLFGPESTKPGVQLVGGVRRPK